MNIVFQKPEDAMRLSALDREIITGLATATGLSSVIVTRTAATPESQARAMFNNAVKDGLAAQYKLYGPFGDKVIDVAAAAVRRSATREEERSDLQRNAEAIKAAMAAKIRELGPENVSHHCVADWSKLHVLDIAANVMTESQRHRLETAIKLEKRIARHFSPYTDNYDPAFHLEVPQR